LLVKLEKPADGGGALDTPGRGMRDLPEQSRGATAVLGRYRCRHFQMMTVGR
jgi:hypothetical protein